MVRQLTVRQVDKVYIYYEFAGNSNDTKPTNTAPTEKIATGSVFLEVDTGAAYFYDEDSAEWIEAGGGDE